MPSGELVGTTLKLTTGREVTDGHSHFPTAAMEGMMERMNALVTAQGGRKHDPAADKENAPPLTNRARRMTSRKSTPDTRRPCVPIARHLSTTSRKNAWSWRRIKTSAGLGGSRSKIRRPDRDWGQQ
jgi:hypothetical protein